VVVPGTRTERVEVEVDLWVIIQSLIRDIRRVHKLYDQGSYQLNLNTEEYKTQDDDNEVEIGHLVAVQHINWEFPQRENYMDRGLPSADQLEALNLIASLEKHLEQSRSFDFAQAQAEKAEAEARLKRDKKRREEAVAREESRSIYARFEEARAS
jgi:hypothetical protein